MQAIFPCRKARIFTARISTTNTYLSKTLQTSRKVCFQTATGPNWPTFDPVCRCNTLLTVDRHRPIFFSHTVADAIGDLPSVNKGEVHQELLQLKSSTVSALQFTLSVVVTIPKKASKARWKSATTYNERPERN